MLLKCNSKGARVIVNFVTTARIESETPEISCKKETHIHFVQWPKKSPHPKTQFCVFSSTIPDRFLMTKKTFFSPPFVPQPFEDVY